MYSVRYNPRHEVVLKRAGNEYKAEDISNDVISISTHKTYGQPVGGFSIVTTYRPAINGKRYDETIRPNDIILIKLDKGDGKGLVPVMVGLVNSIERTRSTSSDGQVMRSVSIQGYDFGKILVKHHCRWYLAPTPTHSGSDTELTEVQYGAALFSGGTPETILKKIVEVEIFKIMPWCQEYILTDRIISPEGSWTTNITTFSVNSTVWSALEQYADKPFNMIYGDTGDDGKYHIILEKCPYDDATGKLQRTVWPTIDTPDIISEQMGINDIDRITYIWNKVMAGQFGELDGGNPLQFLKGDAIQYDPTEADIARNGFIPWYPETLFGPFTTVIGPPIPLQLTNKGAEPNVRRYVKERTDAYWNWYKNNHTFESGTITLHGRPDLRVGGGLLNKENGFEYLIEQITHQYSVWPAPNFRTSLHLTRGQKHGPA